MVRLEQVVKVNCVAPFFLMGVLYLVVGGAFVYCIMDEVLGAVALSVFLGLFCASLFFCVPWRSVSVARRGWVRADLVLDYLAFFLCLVALCFLFFDRYVLRGVDYFSLGMAQARDLINSQQGGGSVFSFLGNFFSMLFVVPLVNTIFQWEGRSRIRWFFLAVASFMMLLLSYLMGGRTVLMITLSVMLACLVGRRVVGKSFLPESFGFLKLACVALVSFFLFGFVFFLRADAFASGDSINYGVGTCRHLMSMLEPAVDIAAVCDGMWSDAGVLGELYNYVLITLLYGFHGLWVADLAIHSQSGEPIILSGLGSVVLNRMGFDFGSHEYAGFFVPAAPALVHDYGWLAMCVVFAFLGVLLRFFYEWLWARNDYFGRFGFVSLYSACILSILIPPSSLPNYFLMCLGVAVLGIFQCLISRFCGFKKELF